MHKQLKLNLHLDYITIILNFTVGFTNNKYYLISTPCPQKNSEVCFLAISQLLLGQIQKVRSVLKSACSDIFKTVLTFDIWPCRS